MSTSKKHPNRVPFLGTLTKLDAASDKAPNGSNGHRVVLTKRAAEEALDTLIGMAVNFSTDWTIHNRRQKCGVIDEAWIEGDYLKVRGYIFDRDFPEVLIEMNKPGVEMGMSYDAIDVQIEDKRHSVFAIVSLTFTGAAILLRNEAAYSDSHCAMVEASAEKFTGKLSVAEGTVELVGVEA